MFHYFEQPRKLFTPLWVRQAATALVVGTSYYLFAWYGVTQTITQDGIAVIWPPNAVLLTAFLVIPKRYWWCAALSALAAEILADVPAFPVWAAIGFGIVNLVEALLAATLILRFCKQPFDFDSVRNAGIFLLCGPVLASILAAFPGALLYVAMDQTASSYFSLWRLWWLGDALGLLLLTPLLVRSFRAITSTQPLVLWSKMRVAELAALWSSIVVLGFLVFVAVEQTELTFHLTPAVMIPLGLWAGARFGVLAAASTAVIISILAVNFVIHGAHPYAESAPQFAVWQMQEYLTIVSILTVGLAIMLHENRGQKRMLTLQYRAMQASNDAVVITDARKEDMPIVWVNPKFEHLFGYKASEVLGKNCRFLQGSDRDQPAITYIKKCLLNKSPCNTTLKNYTKSGDMLWIQLSLAPVQDQNHQISHYVGIQHDLTEEKAKEEALTTAQNALEKYSLELEQRVKERTHSLEIANRALLSANQNLEELASLDYLTGIANRRHFFETARRELQRRGTEQAAVSLIIFDLDHFKEINDRFGHEGGDDVLRAIVDPVKKMIRPMDLFGRIGGEEFLILLPGISIDVATEIARRIRLTFKRLKIPCKEKIIRITSSFGVAQWDGHSDLEHLITQADAALYSAKDQGRDCVCIYTEEDEMQPKKPTV